MDRSQRVSPQRTLYQTPGAFTPLVATRGLAGGLAGGATWAGAGVAATAGAGAGTGVGAGVGAGATGVWTVAGAVGAAGALSAVTWKIM